MSPSIWALQGFAFNAFAGRQADSGARWLLCRKCCSHVWNVGIEPVTAILSCRNGSKTACDWLCIACDIPIVKEAHFVLNCIPGIVVR